jgi:hypothetical protein
MDTGLLCGVKRTAAWKSLARTRSAIDLFAKANKMFDSRARVSTTMRAISVFFQAQHKHC